MKSKHFGIIQIKFVSLIGENIKKQSKNLKSNKQNGAKESYWQDSVLTKPEILPKELRAEVSSSMWWDMRSGEGNLEW